MIHLLVQQAKAGLPEEDKSARCCADERRDGDNEYSNAYSLIEFVLAA